MSTIVKSRLKAKRNYVNKLLRLRNGLIINGKSYINSARAFSIMESMKIWMDAWPNVTEEQFTKFMKRNYESLKYLIPGGECKSKNAWMEQLDDFVNS